MKKYRLLSPLLLLLFTVINCSKDASDDGNTPQNIDKSANLKTTGSSANDILSNTNFDKLLIEVAYVTGFSPTQATMDNFTSYLREHTMKEEIEIIYKPLTSPNETSLSLETISDLENEHRTAYNNGKTLAIYIYFADAPSDGDDEDSNLVTLGAVYRNTSMIIYEVTLRKLAASSNLISVSDVETATLNHEFGHLFGLVDLGSASVNEHEDPEAENHCTTPGCLMRAELQFGGGMMKQMEYNKASKGLATVPVLDEECIADLRANGGR